MVFNGSLYGNLQTDGVEVYLDTEPSGNTVVIIEDEQAKMKYPDSAENRAYLIGMAKSLIKGWKSNR